MSKKNKKVIVENNDMAIEKIVKIFVIILLVFSVVYFLTSLLVSGEIKFKKDVVESIPATIGYDEILAGEIFNRNNEDYYVILYDYESDKIDLINYYITSKFLPYNKMYKVDLSNSFNSYILGDESNINTNNINELKVNDVTLIKVKDGKNDLAIEGIDKINEYFE